ncbi:MAG: hypothetical protein OER04_19680 [Cyclobacteriaceae bacterium]|nr:hypothetical protein [Cyclobacteriaceae bacterium]
MYEDDVITIPELESKDPLVGYAHKFRKVLKPFGGGAPVNTNHTIAQGYLEDGRRFHFEFKARFPGGVDGEFKVKMRIF